MQKLKPHLYYQGGRWLCSYGHAQWWGNTPEEVFYRATADISGAIANGLCMDRFAKGDYITKLNDYFKKTE